ncbi:MAG TPA: hypothetical protein VFC78_03590 [Tepidisphaeraceae bacterium]|nr:hypothetical protein [Tepidisphaeraceae bacterium]
MLNLWIGLCKGASGLPRSIRDLNYKEHLIEWRIINSKNKECKPEFTMCSEDMAHSVLFEWKSGPNTDAHQLESYAGLKPENLQQMGKMSVNATKSFDVAVVGLAEHAERLKIGIAKGKHPFPLLLVHDDGMSLAMNKFSCPALNDLFVPSFSVEYKKAPSQFVPVDADSLVWEVADVVIPQILKHMSLRDTLIDSSVIAQAISPQWQIMHKEARAQTKHRVEEAIEQAAAGEFSSYLTWDSRASKASIIDNPMEFGLDKRSNAFRKMLKLHAQFRDRLQSGRKYEYQMRLPL